MSIIHWLARLRRLSAWKRLLWTLRFDLLTLWYALKDPGGPLAVKLLSLLLPLYLISPFDLVPDFLILLGIIDDLVVIPLGVRLLLKLVPEPVLARCRARAAEKIGAPGPL